MTHHSLTQTDGFSFHARGRFLHTASFCASYDLQKWRAFALYCGAAELYAIYSVQYGTHPVICYLTFLGTLSSISEIIMDIFNILHNIKITTYESFRK